MPARDEQEVMMQKCKNDQRHMYGGKNGEIVRAIIAQKAKLQSRS